MSVVMNFAAAATIVIGGITYMFHDAIVQNINGQDSVFLVYAQEGTTINSGGVQSSTLTEVNDEEVAANSVEEETDVTLTQESTVVQPTPEEIAAAELAKKKAEAEKIVAANEEMIEELRKIREALHKKGHNAKENAIVGRIHVQTQAMKRCEKDPNDCAAAKYYLESTPKLVAKIKEKLAENGHQIAAINQFAN